MIPMHLTIFGGITGFDKTEFIKSFTLQCFRKYGYPQDLYDEDSKRFIHYIKFEDELLAETEAVSVADFLAKPSFPEKIKSIEKTYLRIGRQIEDNEAEHVFLDIHLSCLYQSQFFPPIYSANLRELDPLNEATVKVVTLIDDVFVIWQKLREREDLYPNTSLRLREILAWRSVELLQAEAVAFHYTTEERPARNYLFAIRHPFDSLHNLLFNKDPIGLYLSYPITRTRNIHERVQDINNFRKSMYDMGRELEVVILDPVTIDELALTSAPLECEFRVLSEKNRWPLETELLVSEPDWPINIPEVEVEEARRDISNNIRQRDFKLIDQSIFTTVYRKNFGGSSKGVIEEIRYTNSSGKRAYVYDPLEDGNGGVPHPFDQDEIGSRTVEEFYDRIRKGIDYYKTKRQK